MKSTISVIISVYNQASYLSQCLESILSQTYPAKQVIIINDGSTDNTPAVLNSFRKHLKVIHHPHRLGLAKSLNQGLVQATGKYIARMDADDIAYPKRFAAQVKFLDQNPSIAACGTYATLINQAGKIIGEKHYPSSPLAISRVIMRYNPLIHPTVMMRTSVIQKLSGYNESLNGAEDFDLWLRLNQKYQLANLRETLLNYRINPRGISWAQIKKVESQAIRVRWKALTHYNYPKWQAIYLIKPLLSFLVPTLVKKTIFRI